MDWLREFARRIRMLLGRREAEMELEEEMRLHLELLQQEKVDSGMSEENARALARRKFGNTTALKERVRTAQGWEWLEDFVKDAKYGVRAMLRSPGITLVALLSLALGIGANTAIFSLMDTLMLKSLPVEEPGQLVLFGDGLDEGISDYFPNRTLYSYPFFREMKKRNQVFSNVAAAFSMTDRVHGFVEGNPEPQPMSIQMVSGSYFAMLGVHAVKGRLIMEEDDRTEGAAPVAVVSFAWWTRNAPREASALDKKLTLGSTVFQIVGVTPPEFFGTKVGEAPDIWIPLSMQKKVPPGFDGFNDEMFESLHLMARLRHGVTLAEATSNANLLFQQILRGFSKAPLTEQNLRRLEKAHVRLNSMATGFSFLRFQFSEPLKVLMAVVGLVLLVACANIANLLLARASSRVRELAVRRALGAGRFRLIRQLLTESLTLALAGGALGVAFASVATRFLIRMIASGDSSLQLHVSVDARLLLFTLAVTLATALLFGTIPAFRATRADIGDSLKEGRGQAVTRGKGPLAKTLVTSQVAVSLVLLVGSGLLVRSLINLASVDTGFHKENLLRLRIDPSSVGYKADQRLLNMYQQIEERVGSLPGVQAASFSIFAFNEGTWNNSIWVQGYPSGHSEVDVHHNAVGDGYFAAMGIPLIEGRTFRPQDTASSTRVGVIGETTARTLFPSGSPIGKHYGRSADKAGDIEVIGVVKDVKYNRLEEPQQPGDYLPYRQNLRLLNDLEVRFTGSASGIVSLIRAAIREVDPDLPISEVITMEDQVARSIVNQRLLAQLSAFFGGLALFLSCIGIYGLMSYLVTKRVSEIGLRMALGARRSQVLWLVMREGLWMVTLGVATGIPVAFIGDHLLRSVLFGVRGTDAISLLAAASILCAVAAIAGYLPARRASLIDPMASLRCE